MELMKIKSDIQKVLQVFAQNEMGNKLTQFNLMGLSNMIMGVIDGTVIIQQQGQPAAPAPVETHRVELPDEEDEDETDE